MSNFINKTLKRSRAVRLEIYKTDHRMRTYYVIPTDGIFVKIKDQKYVINPTNVFFKKRMPTFMFRENDVSPINPLDFSSGIDMTAEDLYNRSESKLASKFINATDSNINIGVIALIVSGLTLLGLIAVYMGLSEQIKTIQELLSGV